MLPTDPLYTAPPDFERGYRAGLDAKPTLLFYVLLGTMFIAGFAAGWLAR